MSGIKSTLNEKVFDDIYDIDAIDSKNYLPGKFVHRSTNLNDPNQYVIVDDSNRKTLSFTPSPEFLTASDKNFLMANRQHGLTFRKLEEICPRYYHKLLKISSFPDLEEQQISSIFNTVGYDLTLAIGLIFGAPLMHKIQKHQDDKFYNIVIKCANTSCKFFVVYNYDQETKMLVLNSERLMLESDICILCGARAESNFRIYTLLNPKVKLLERLPKLDDHSIENVESICSSYELKTYETMNFLTSTITLTSQELNLLSSLNESTIFPYPAIDRTPIKKDKNLPVDSGVNVKWNHYVDYIFYDCEKNGNDFELITSSPNTVDGLISFCTESIALFQKYKNFNIHFEELKNPSINKFKTYFIIGELPNNKSHILSTFIVKDKNRDNLILFMKSTLIKLNNPYKQLTEHDLSNKKGPFDSPKRISYFCHYKSYQRKLFDSLGLSLHPVNNYILVALIKSANKIELNDAEAQSLKMFNLNPESSVFIEDCINYGVLGYYRDCSIDEIDIFSKSYKHSDKEWISRLPKVFQLICDVPGLVKDIVEKKHGPKFRHQITEKQIKKFQGAYRKTRDLNEFLDTLCILMYCCLYHLENNDILNVLVTKTFNENASKVSWVFNSLLAQQNVNFNGDLNSKVYREVKVGDLTLKWHIRDDFGTGSDLSNHKVVNSIFLDQKHSLNNAVRLLRKIDSLNSTRLDDLAPVKFDINVHNEMKLSRKFMTNFRSLRISNLNLNNIGGAMINYLFYYVSQDVYYYNDVFRTLRDEIIIYLEKEETEPFEPVRTTEFLTFLCKNAELEQHFSEMIEQFIFISVKTFEKGSRDIDTFATQISCKAFLMFMKSFDCGQHFRSNEVELGTNLHPTIFNYKLLNRSFAKYNCNANHFECVHKFVQRINIQFIGGRFEMTLSKCYMQDDIPSQYKLHDNSAYEEDYRAFQNSVKDKIKSLDRIPKLKPFIDTLDFTATTVCDTSSESMLEASQFEINTEEFRKEKEKLLSEESDDTVDEGLPEENEKLVEDFDPAVENEFIPEAVVPAKLEEAEVPEDVEQPSTEVPQISNRHVSIKEEYSEAPDCLNGFEFLPVLPKKKPYNIKVFRNIMKRRLEKIQSGETQIIGNTPSNKFRKRRMEVQLIQPQRVLRRTKLVAEPANKRAKNRKITEVDNFFLGMDSF